MALDDTIPADGNGVTNGVKISQLAGHIRDLKSDLNDGKLSIIGDNDGDTRIDVEETADEDIIHFYADGNEGIRIKNNGRVLISSPDNATEIDIGREYGWLKVRRYPFTNNVRGFSQASNADWKTSGETYKTFGTVL